MFFDSNILVYSSLQDDKEKHNIVLNLWRQLEGNFIFISTQVVNEVYVSLLKHALTDKDIQNIVLKIIDVCNVSVITIDSIKSAWKTAPFSCINFKIFLSFSAFGGKLVR